MKSSIGADLDSSAAYRIPSHASGVNATVEPDEIFTSIPPHPLGIKPAGNQFTASSNDREAIGRFQILPDEALIILLEYLDSSALTRLGSTCKALFAFCHSDDLWKTLFIEWSVFFHESP
jgi:hypothetical protein